jgi:ABC-type enterochelin transport system ATPase subunit
MITMQQQQNNHTDCQMRALVVFERYEVCKMHSDVLQYKRCATFRDVIRVMKLRLQQWSLVNVLAGTTEQLLLAAMVYATER